MPSGRRSGSSGWEDPLGLKDFASPDNGRNPDEATERAGDREELITEALRTAGVGVWELDLASQTLSWSDETFRILGLEPGSQQPTNELFYSLVQEDDRARMLSRQQISYETGHIFDEEYRIIRPDGELRYLNSRAQIVARGPERNNRFLGIVRDITERRIFEQKLEAERAVAERLQADLIHLSRVSAMDAMASTMAHELNQPLTSVLNYAAVVRQIAAGQADAALLPELAEALQDNARRAAAIIRQLRDMTIRREVHKEPVGLERCVREATSLALAGAPVAVTYAVPQDLCVEADRIQLQQVIVNLVRNAIEATAGVEDPRIDIDGVDAGAVVRLRVRDNGAGIAEEVLPTIFESFVSTKEQGMGVGLAISRTIVEAHGGHLTVVTERGGGTSFTVTLPATGAGDRPSDEHCRQR